MKRLLLFFWCFAFAHQRCSSTTIAPMLRSINLAGGNILGAALSSDSSSAYLEQLTLPSGVEDRANGTFTVSAVDTLTLRLRTSRTFGVNPGTLSRLPCRDLRTGTLSGRVYTCCGDNLIEVLDPVDLHTIKSIRAPLNRNIRSFSVDEVHDQLFLLTDQVNVDVRLQCVNLSNERLVKSTRLQVSEILLGSVAGNRDGSYLAVGINQVDRAGANTNLFICSISQDIRCRERGGIGKIGSLLFLGAELLVVPSGRGDRKSSCILALDLDADSSKRVFCDSKAGVHFSAAAVGKGYLVAYTGLNREKLFSELVRSLWSAISVWDLATRKEIATIELPKDFTHHGAIATLVGSDGQCFLAYQAGYTSSVAFLGQLRSAPAY